MNNLHVYALCLAITGLLLSCESILDRQPVGVVTDESMLATAEGIDGLLTGAYALLNGTGWMNTNPDQPLFGVIHGGECFKGSYYVDQPSYLEFSQFKVTEINSELSSFWQFGYDAVFRCNLVMTFLSKTSDMTENEKVETEAEARFLRAHYYFYLKRAFGNIPWIDETTADYRVPNTIDNNGIDYVDIWPLIAEDMDFARKNLPVTQIDLGRPNKWAADAYYAKILMYRASLGDYPDGFDEALVILTDVIDHGVTARGDNYDLLPNYHDNFDAATENGPESVWAVQLSVNDGTPISASWRGSSPNGDAKSQLICPGVAGSPGLGRGWCFYAPTPWYVDHFRTDASGLPYLDMYATNPVRVKDDYGLPAAPPAPEPDPFQIDTIGVDPRLDWTVSRRGIPCLDYGPFPGSSWIRDQASAGPYMTKKWYIWKSQDGTYTAVNSPKTAINIPVIRFADVLLLAAECEARTGSLDNARDLVNRVRKRMMDNSESPKNRVKKEDGITDAANYRIGLFPTGGPADPFQSVETALDAILFERTLELGTEGHRFYDVVRFGKGEEIFNEFLATESIRFDYLSGHEYTDIPDALLPIPTEVIEKSLKDGKTTITQNPGY
ncbi:MAG: RagB/SusD family nutrient uptake outer membrane protein [Bacteroidales bacterium]|nr:RagB/SusD family nutrient uptake outer membrane protein [Bacteroidales bacterium]